MNEINEKKITAEDFFMCLINTAENKDILDVCPHRDMYDMSIVYRLVLEKNDILRATVLVTNDMAHSLGLTEAQLYAYGIAHTANALQLQIVSLTDAVDDLMKQSEDEELKKAREEESKYSEEHPMWVSSTPYNHFGASILMCDSKLSSLADCIGTNLYIIPSSIDECIMIPAINDLSAAELAEMLHMVNDTLDDGMILSDNIYYYDNQKHELSIVED